MNRSHLVIGLLILTTVSSAIRADTASEGFRVGLQMGYGILDTDLTVSRPPVGAITPTDISHVGGRGVIGGINLDYMAMIGHSDTMLGAEASFNFMTTKGRKSIQGTLIFAGNTTSQDLSTTVFQKRSYDFTAKFGYLFKDAAVAYVKAGPSLTSWKALTVSNALTARGEAAKSIFGLILAIGAEFPTSERFSWGFEYAYRRSSNLSYNLSTRTPPPLQNLSVGLTSSAIMFRFNYKLSSVDFSTTAPKERKRKKHKRSQPEG
jgi:opacity protein-like surface antigen